MTRDEFYQSVIGDALEKVHAKGRRDGLDEAWCIINDLLPGSFSEALEIIERLGGMDPLKRGKE